MIHVTCSSHIEKNTAFLRGTLRTVQRWISMDNYSPRTFQQTAALVLLASTALKDVVLFSTIYKL